MKGKNRIDTLRKAAEDIIDRLNGNENVTGILYTGGLTRGFADKYSDLDIFVFLSQDSPAFRKQVKSISREIEQKHSVETDIEVHVLDSFMEQEWSEYLKWDLSNSKIVFDRDGALSKKLSGNLKLDNELARLRIAKDMVYISWYCFPERREIPSMIDLWDDRGDAISAHYAVSYAMELIIEILYALNQSHVPAPKWRMHCIHSLDWIPKDFQVIMERAMLIKEISAKEARKRASALLPLWKEILNHIQQTSGLDYEQAKKLYIEKVLHLSVN